MLQPLPLWHPHPPSPRQTKQVNWKDHKHFLWHGPKPPSAHSQQHATLCFRSLPPCQHFISKPWHGSTVTFPHRSNRRNRGADQATFSDSQNSSRRNTKSCYLPPQHGSCKGCASRLQQQAGSAEKRACALNCFSHEKAAQPEVMLFTPVIRLQKQLLKSTGHKLLIGQGRVAQ